MNGENYILRLQRENAEKADEIRRIQSELTDLKIYLGTWKFTSSAAGDLRGYVNCDDVIARLPRVYAPL